MNNLRKCHYDEPTPVQQHAIPVILAKRDLMATAQTGSGKTVRIRSQSSVSTRDLFNKLNRHSYFQAAYLLPIIHTILNDNYESTGGICAPQVLILSPTRELVIQIHDVAKKFTQGSYLKVRLLYGGTSMGYQNKQLQVAESNYGRSTIDNRLDSRSYGVQYCFREAVIFSSQRRAV